MIVGYLPMANVGLAVDEGQGEAYYVTSSIHTVSSFHVLQSKNRCREKKCVN